MSHGSNIRLLVSHKIYSAARQGSKVRETLLLLLLGSLPANKNSPLQWLGYSTGIGPYWKGIYFPSRATFCSDRLGNNIFSYNKSLAGEKRYRRLDRGMNLGDGAVYSISYINSMKMTMPSSCQLVDMINLQSVIFEKYLKK